jgi:hypothetical protein
MTALRYDAPDIIGYEPPTVTARRAVEPSPISLWSATEEQLLDDQVLLRYRTKNT